MLHTQRPVEQWQAALTVDARGVVLALNTSSAAARERFTVVRRQRVAHDVRVINAGISMTVAVTR